MIPSDIFPETDIAGAANQLWTPTTGVQWGESPSGGATYASVADIKSG